MAFLGKSLGAVGVLPAAGAAAVGLAFLTSVADEDALRSPAPAISVDLETGAIAAGGRHRAEGAAEITIRLAMAAPDDPPAASHGPGPPEEALDRTAPPEPMSEAQPAAAAPKPRPKPARPTVASHVPPPTPPVPTGPRIALIIDDMGVDVRRSAQMVALPGPITLSYLPYAPHLKAQVKAARAAGHKLMVHVPMEPEGTVAQPGPKALDIGLTRAQILQRLDWALSRFDGYGGVNNHMGSRFTVDAGLMRTVLTRLKKRGLFFVDSVTVHGSTGARIAQSIGLPHARRDVFLDHKPDDVPIDRRLRELERIARANGVAVGIGHPRDGTIAALKRWLPAARRAGFVFVPVAEVVRAVPPVAAQVAEFPADEPS